MKQGVVFPINRNEYKDANGNERDKIWQLRFTEKHKARNGGFTVPVFYFKGEETAITDPFFFCI